MASDARLSAVGTTRESCAPLPPPGASTCTTLGTSKSSSMLATLRELASRARKRSSSLLVCQASTSEGTSAARSTTSSVSTQTTATSTKTSPLASTGRGPDLLPYWTASTKEVSERLWWPAIDSQGSGWSSSS